MNLTYSVFFLAPLMMNINLGIAKPVVKSIEVTQYLDSVSKRKSSATRPPLSNSLNGSEKVTDAVLKYRVIKKSHSPVEVNFLSNALNIRNSDVKFIERKGAYFYQDKAVASKVLEKSDSAYLETLRAVAENYLSKILGDDRKYFVFAHTISIMRASKKDREPRLVEQGFRFVRKLNGAFVPDNTAYATIHLSGKAELSSFEFANPSFEAIPVNRISKFSAINSRLEKFAQDKKTARVGKSNTTVPVKSITVQKAWDTYLAKQRGNQTILIPHLSLYTQIDLENGESFKKFVNFSYDADFASDLTPDLVEIISKAR